MKQFLWVAFMGIFTWSVWNTVAIPATVLGGNNTSSTQGVYSLHLPAVVAQSGIGDYPRFTNLTPQGNGASFAPVSNADATVVAFLSEASNLVEGDTNGVMDAFVWQKAGGVIRRVSVASNGTQANDESTDLAISENGRYILFMTRASNLVEGDTNPRPDVYRHDLHTGVTEWVSMTLNNDAPDGMATDMEISADGRWVVFSSQARNITTVPLPDSCPEVPCETLYRRDMQTGVTETLFQDENGIAIAPLRNPSLSADGQSVTYEQMVLIGYISGYPCAPHTPIYGTDLYLAHIGTAAAPVKVARSFYKASIYVGDGDYCGDSILSPQGYIDRQMASKPLMARHNPSKILWERYTSSDTQYNHGYSTSLMTYDPLGNANERVLYKFSFSSNRRDTLSPMVLPIRTVALSADGRRAVFGVNDLNLNGPSYRSTPYIEGDNNGYMDLYDYNYATDTLVRITDAPDGRLGDGQSFDPSMSADGQAIVFASATTYLTENDTNGMIDIILWQTVR